MKGLFQKKGSSVWWVAFTPAPGAAQVKVTTGERDEAAAIIRAREIKQTAALDVKEQMESCASEVDAWLAFMIRDGLSASTVSSRGYILRPFCKAMGVPTPRGISREKLQKWFDERWSDYPQTAVAYLNVVSWWFEWLVERGKLAVNPAAGVVVPQKLAMQPRRRFLSPKDARRVIDQCEDDGLKFALYCGLQAGFRKLEVIEALPTWFDLDAGLVHIVESLPWFQPKTREKRTVPLTKEFRAWLRDYGLRGPFMLAPDVARGKYRYRYDFRTAFENYMQSLGLGDVTFHDLRRTFASLLVSDGVSVYKVAKWIGDTVEQTESTYGHLLPQDDEINPSWALDPKGAKGSKRVAKRAPVRRVARAQRSRGSVGASRRPAR